MHSGPGPVTFTGQYIEPVTPAAEPFIELFATIGDIHGTRWHDLTNEELVEATCAMVEQVPAAGSRLRDFRLTINIDPRAVNKTVGTAIMHAATLLPGQLAVEILETAPLTADTIIELYRWHNEGVELLVDDYGSGHADNIRLTEVPWDGVKLSHTLTRPAGCGHHDSRQTIRALTGTYSTVIAEGVEDRDTYETLRLLGVSHIQGWYVDRPGPLDRFNTQK